MKEALYLLEQLNLLLDKEDRLRDRIKVLILISVILKRLDQTEAALVQLEAALQLAEPQGYIRSFIDEGTIMAGLLSAYLKVQQGSGLRNTPSVSLAYVKQLLQALQVAQEEELSLKGILTDQETRVLRLIADGLSNKEVAHSLNITAETVKTHIKNVYRKLGVNNRVQALQSAKQLGTLA
jgi:LuxR family maltose regulon positive regulatory protein